MIQNEDKWKDDEREYDDYDLEVSELYDELIKYILNSNSILQCERESRKDITRDWGLLQYYFGY